MLPWGRPLAAPELPSGGVGPRGCVAPPPPQHTWTPAPCGTRPRRWPRAAEYWWQGGGVRLGGGAHGAPWRGGHGRVVPHKQRGLLAGVGRPAPTPPSAPPGQTARGAGRQSQLAPRGACPRRGRGRGFGSWYKQTNETLTGLGSGTALLLLLHTDAAAAAAAAAGQRSRGALNGNLSLTSNITTSVVTGKQRN